MTKRLAMTAFVLVFAVSIIFGGCSNAPSADSVQSNNSVTIFCSSDENTLGLMRARLAEKFPDYIITVEYMTSGSMAAKILAEDTDISCDIVFDFEYGHLSKIEHLLADLSSYDMSKFVDDMLLPSEKLVPDLRNGGCIAINTDILSAKGLSAPSSYQDLLNPEYKNLISMPNPSSSGTGYMFVKNLVNVMGQQQALDYFDALADNILQFTSSGSGPVNALIQGEAAIGLAMTSQAVAENNKGANLDIVFFEEGSPFSKYGAGIIEGRQDDAATRAVFDYIYEEFILENHQLYWPESLFKDISPQIENYPQNIPYADMSGDTADEKELLLQLWKY